jgi:TonB family protein
LALVGLAALSAWAQKPLAVSSAELTEHVVRRTPVEYPAVAKAAHVSGTVVLLVSVSSTGRVAQAEVLSGPPMLRAAVQKSVEQWEFQPFVKDGAPVAAVGMLRVNPGPREQATAVEKFLDTVRAKYATEPGLAAQGFRCRVEPEWGEFPELRGLAADSPLLDRLKRTRMRLVVKQADAPLIEVDAPKRPKPGVAELADANQMVATARQMVQGFYMTWLSFGMVGPSAPADALLKQANAPKTRAKTVIEFKQGGMTDWMSFDGADRMLHFTELMPNGAAMEETPQFVASPKGLLYTGTKFDSHHASDSGETDTFGAYRIAYGQVDGFRMPKVVEVVVQGGLDVHLRFSGCRVGD